MPVTGYPSSGSLLKGLGSFLMDCRRSGLESVGRVKSLEEYFQQLLESGTGEMEESQDLSVIGSSAIVKGEFSEGSPLLIHGRVEGEINLKKEHVTLGSSGSVVGDIYGRIVTVEGEVEGHIFGVEKIIIRESGRVRGDMTAPAIVVEEGAKFDGNVNTSEKLTKQKKTVAKKTVRAKLASNWLQSKQAHS